MVRVPDAAAPRVLIVDYGVGHLYSVENACRQVGLRAEISGIPHDLADADGAVLPGIGAFGDAVATLRRLDFIEPLRDLVASGKPVMGVCLGMQLLMTESYEFGPHKGLGVIEGTVEHLGRPMDHERALKVPHVGWTRVDRAGRSWAGTALSGIPDGSYMYFVHSYRVLPADPGVVLSEATYGDVTFCSSVQTGAVFGCQFHPERSTRLGLQVYRNFRYAVAETVPPISV